MKTLVYILVLGCALYLAVGGRYANDYFYCDTDGGYISLEINGDYLLYEMKKDSENKFGYASRAPAYNGFSYIRKSSLQDKEVNLNFNSNGENYTLFKKYQNGKSLAGVSVVNPLNNNGIIYKCKRIQVDRLLFLLTKINSEREPE
ncbi:hypothetical protein ACU62C_23220 [Klebsiella aerogenes]